MNPINLNMPITGNCDNFNCCFPSRSKHKNRKHKQDTKVQDVAKVSLEKKEAEKL